MNGHAFNIKWQEVIWVAVYRFICRVRWVSSRVGPKLGHECVFASEIDPELRDIYQRNYGIVPHGDIREIAPSNIPEHDILCAGVPCQPFSKAGFQRGLEDQVRGTLFGNIAGIVKVHKPEYLILENVGNFERHDNGNTWQTVKQTLTELGYDVLATEHKATGGSGLLSPHHLGFPHHRERFFIVCSRSGLRGFKFPARHRKRMTFMEDIVEDELGPVERKETRMHKIKMEMFFLLYVSQRLT
jgi:DNA (cytosine-5)-methyltransferase 1